MFKPFLTGLGWILVVLIVVWSTGLVFTNNTCTRIHRTGWPAWYTFELVDFVSQNWTAQSTKFTLLKYKIHSTVAMQEFFQTTIYGDRVKCKL
jgi:hypothetical protein